MKFAARVLTIVLALSACAVAVHVLLNHQGVSPVNYRAAGLGAVSSLGGEPSDPFIGYFTGHWCDCWRKANLPPIEEMKLYEGVLPRAICPAQAKVITLNTEGMTPQEKFLAQVFVGLVNRRAPLWYLVEKDDFWYRGRRAPWRVGIAGEPFQAPYGKSSGMSAEVGYRVSAEDFLWGLKRFYNELVPIMIKGVVIYDPALLDPNAKPSHPRALLNVIRTLCAVEQALPVTPELYEKLTRAKVENPSLGDRTPLPVFLDTRTRKDWMISSYNGDEKEAESRLYTWAFNNLWKNCDHHAVCFIPPMGNPSRGNDLTDYATQFKLFCFYAGDDTKGDERLLEYVLGQSPMNIPVVGTLTWQTGERYVADRTRLLRLFSRFGKFFVDFADAPNVSFHSGERYPQRTTYKQKPIRFRQLDPAKTYVSFVLTNGNSLGRLMSARAVHWDHASRGSLPIAWSLPIAAADACPNILTYYYNTATENDYFVADFSGVGEMFPSVYGAVTKDRMQLVAAYLNETDRYMGYMDLKELWVEQSDAETESAFLEGLSNLRAMLYGRKAARSYL
ncbi:MAG: GxGYxYP family putative glycoside hydrolase, partial [bacterium]|nr:GxGYxYP family putative glycoside hydrolase [bacterium]